MGDKLFLGFDTSCYTTSIACVSIDGIVCDERTVLSVVQGNRGLRQSEALFQHNRNLSQLSEKVFPSISVEDIAGVGVSMAPTSAEDSYMPVFLAGRMAASVCAGSRGVPLYPLNHQAGHIRAALYGNEALLKKQQFLAIHLSGGTSDLLKVNVQDGIPGEIEPLGCSQDLHAGQLVDRIGVLLGLPFPCGKHLEQLAVSAKEKNLHVSSCVRGLSCSFSGAETAIEKMLKEGLAPEEAAYAVYDLMARSLEKWIRNAVDQTGIRHILISGGVASSNLLRQLLCARFPKSIHILFGRPELSSDNAVGIALLARDIAMVGEKDV